jgi:predicted nucleic acid-binding protein
MNAKVFIDSNVFLYAFIDKEPQKHAIAQALVLGGQHTLYRKSINY